MISNSNYPAYDLMHVHEPSPNELDSSAIIDGDDDDDDDEDEDDDHLIKEHQLFDTMISNHHIDKHYPHMNRHKRNHSMGKKSSTTTTTSSSVNGIENLIFNEDLLNMNRSKSLSLMERPILQIPHDNGSHLDSNNNKRRPLSHINGNINDDKKPSRLSMTQKKRGGKNVNDSHDNEIFTCRLVNLITNEPCMAEFSRIYDLTRHQNTIHAKKKIVFRCSECIKMMGHEGYSKTFSRLDALTRHIKSKHEDLTPEQRQYVTKYAKENIGYVMG